jgi:hypothetical protein
MLLYWGCGRNEFSGSNVRRKFGLALLTNHQRRIR